MRHQDWLWSIIFSRITPIDDFTDISGTTHPNSASDSDSQPWGSINPSSSRVIDQVIFPFISYLSHDESLCFVLLLIFSLIYHLICHALTNVVMRQNFPELSLAHCWVIAYRLVTMLLSHSCFPDVYKEAVLPQRMENQILGFTLSLAFLSKILSSTVLITASGFVITLIKVSTTLITSSECVHITSAILYQRKVSE